MTLYTQMVFDVGKSHLELPTCQAHSLATYTPVHSYSGSLSTVHQATIPAHSQWIYLLGLKLYSMQEII